MSETLVAAQIEISNSLSFYSKSRAEKAEIMMSVERIGKEVVTVSVIHDGHF